MDGKKMDVKLLHNRYKEESDEEESWSEEELSWSEEDDQNDQPNKLRETTTAPPKSFSPKHKPQPQASATSKSSSNTGPHKETKIAGNGFFQYMKEMRQGLESQGSVFEGGWKDVAAELNSAWQEMSLEKKEVYRAKAQRTKEALGLGQVQDNRLASTGCRFSELIDAKVEQGHQEMLSRMEVRDYLGSTEPQSTTIVVINVCNYIEDSGTLFIPGEIAFTAFSVNKGIIDNYWSLIDPYYIPVGFGLDVMTRSEKIGLPIPPYSNLFQDYRTIITNVGKFVKKHQNPRTGTTMVFCQREEMKATNAALTWLYGQIDESNNVKLSPLEELTRQMSSIGIIFQAKRNNLPLSLVKAKHMNEQRLFMILDVPSYSAIVPTAQSSFDAHTNSSGYDTLSEELAMATTSNQKMAMPMLHGRRNAQVSKSFDADIMIAEHSNRISKPETGFYREEDVGDFLAVQQLAYPSSLCCFHHMPPDREGFQYCALHTTNRYAYVVLSALLPHFGICPVGGFHCLDKIHPRNEEQRRVHLLLNWGHWLPTFMNPYTYDGNPPKEYSTRIVDHLHPRNAGRPE